MMFSSHIDMIRIKIVPCKTYSQNYCLSSVGSPRRYPLYEKVMSGHFSTNSGIHYQFRIYYKVGKASQLWVSSCSAQIH